MPADLPDPDEADRLAVERLPALEARPVERVRLLRRDRRLDAAGDEARAELRRHARVPLEEHEHRHHRVLGDAVQRRRGHGRDRDAPGRTGVVVDGAAAQLDPDDAARRSAPARGLRRRRSRRGRAGRRRRPRPRRPIRRGESRAATASWSSGSSSTSPRTGVTIPGTPGTRSRTGGGPPRAGRRAPGTRSGCSPRPRGRTSSPGKKRIPWSVTARRHSSSDGTPAPLTFAQK